MLTGMSEADRNSAIGEARGCHSEQSVYRELIIMLRLQPSTVVTIFLSSCSMRDYNDVRFVGVPPESIGIWL